jgi:UDP-N-acetyl-D-glucosamine dehydrogenase
VPELPQYGLAHTDLGGDVDLAVIVTAHPGVDHGTVVETSRAVLDLRGVTRALNDAKVQQL